jgi:hypothetical protein
LKRLFDTFADLHNNIRPEEFHCLAYHSSCRQFSAADMAPAYRHMGKDASKNINFADFLKWWEARERLLGERKGGGGGSKLMNVASPPSPSSGAPAASAATGTGNEVPSKGTYEFDMKMQEDKFIENAAGMLLLLEVAIFNPL